MRALIVIYICGFTLFAQSPDTWRRRANAKGLFVSSAVTSTNAPGDGFVNDPQYSPLINSQFNMIQPEAEEQFAAIMVVQGVYDFTLSDRLMDWAVAHNKRVKMCCLLYAATVGQDWALPPWFWTYSATLTSAQLQTFAVDYVTTVITHFRDKYPGVTYAWDIGNEWMVQTTSNVTDNTIVLRSSSPWTDSPGLPHTSTRLTGLEQIFTLVRSLDPTIKLCMNEFLSWTDSHGTMQYYSNLIDSFQANGVPIDCMGIQGHAFISAPTVTSLAPNIATLATKGIDAQLTEVDVDIGTSTPSGGQLATQATVYQQIFSACWSAANCKLFQVWGSTDKYGNTGADGNADPWTIDYVAKPAVASILGTMPVPHIFPVPGMVGR